jgi:predicted metal-binding membrane protein
LNFNRSEPPVSILEYTAKKERWIVLASLALVAALGLFATLQLGDMLMMPSAFVGGAIVYPVLLFCMWWTMMMAMMLPSAAPAILTFGALSRKFADQGASVSSLPIFIAGYAAVWTGFAAVAVALQLLASQKIALSMMMAVVSGVVGGSLLIAAGLYQMSPLKSACLRKCQTPLLFFANNWRKGSVGAFRMGLSHGIYCLGCCWVLMGLLFYGGVMELRWIVGLALYVAAEKLIPAGNWLSRFTGILLIGWGALLVYRALA